MFLGEKLIAEADEIDKQGTAMTVIDQKRMMDMVRVCKTLKEYAEEHGWSCLLYDYFAADVKTDMYYELTKRATSF